MHGPAGADRHRRRHVGELGGESGGAPQSDDRQMRMPSQVLDFNQELSARFARHERLRPGARRITRPVRSRFNSWTTVYREPTDVAFVPATNLGRHALRGLPGDRVPGRTVAGVAEEAVIWGR